MNGAAREEVRGLPADRESTDGGSGTTVWLWDAGLASGACPDLGTALERAETFGADGCEAWVEKAVTLTAPGRERVWIRTGAVRVGRPGRDGTRRWTQVPSELSPADAAGT